MQNQYEGLFARFYNLLQSDCPELPAYKGFIEKYGKKVLELGCGSGRLTIPLAKAGAAMTGLDLNGDMLESDGKQEVFEFADDSRGTVIKDYFLPEYDFVNGIETDRIKLEEYAAGKVIETAETVETMAFYFPREIRHLVETNGYFVESGFGSLLKGTPLTKRSSEMVFVCGIR